MALKRRLRQNERIWTELAARQQLQSQRVGIRFVYSRREARSLDLSGRRPARLLDNGYLAQVDSVVWFPLQDT